MTKVKNVLNVKYSESTGNSSLIYHLKTKHEISLINNNEQKNNEKMPKVIHNKNHNDEITELLIEWIIDDKQAFKVVENNKFKNFIKILDPTYALPVRQTVSLKVDNMYSNKFEFLKVIVFE